MIKIGIIGCGTVMNRYLDVFLNEKIAGAKVVAVCDSNIEVADKRAREFKSQVFYSSNDFVRNKVPHIFLSVFARLEFLHRIF